MSVRGLHLTAHLGASGPSGGPWDRWVFWMVGQGFDDMGGKKEAGGVKGRSLSSLWLGTWIG